MPISRFQRSPLGGFIRSTLGVRGSGTPVRVFIAYRRAAGEMALICVQQASDGASASVLWARTIACAAGSLYVQMASYKGKLFVVFAQDTTSDASVLRIDESSGTTLTSKVLLRDNGGSGAVLDRPGIAVNDSGVFIVDTAGKTYANSLGGNYKDFELWRLNATDLSEEKNTVNDFNITIDNGLNSGWATEPPLWYTNGVQTIGRSIVLPNSTDGPTVGSRYANLYRYDTNCEVYDPAGFAGFPGTGTGFWYTQNFEGAGGNLPGSNYHPYISGDSVSDIMSKNDTQLFHWTGHKPTVVPADNVFRSTSPSQGTIACYPVASAASPVFIGGFVISGSWLVRKATPQPPSNVTIYYKVLGTDFLSDVTISAQSALSVMLYSGTQIIVLYRGRINGVDAALLVSFTESGTTWTEDWRLDLTADSTSNWTNPRTTSSHRSWAANVGGNGFDHGNMFGW